MSKPKQTQKSKTEPLVKLNRNKNEIVLVAKFTEPNEAQLSAVSRALLQLLKK